MGYYRLYLLDGPKGRFVGFEEIEAADDDEAVRIAEEIPDGHARELWCGKRKVKNFAARDVAAVMACYALFIATLAGIGLWQHFGAFYYAGLAVATKNTRPDA